MEGVFGADSLAFGTSRAFSFDSDVFALTFHGYLYNVQYSCCSSASLILALIIRYGVRLDKSLQLVNSEIQSVMEKGENRTY